LKELYIKPTGNERTILVKSPEIVKIENTSNTRLDLSLFRKKGNSKTYEGYLIQKMKESRNEGNLDVAELIQHFYKKYLEFKPKKENLIKIEIIDGWKGSDIIDITYFEHDFLIETHNKDKESGEVTTSKHLIQRGDVNRLLLFIRKWKINESHKCYDFANTLGEKDWKEVWKKRTDVYFPKYYFPIKILEKLRIIKYTGRGLITRIL
jgi:hypothetical protein